MLNLLDVMNRLNLPVQDARALMETGALPVTEQCGQLYVSEPSVEHYLHTHASDASTGNLINWAHGLHAFLSQLREQYHARLLPDRMNTLYQHLALPLASAASQVLQEVMDGEHDEVRFITDRLRRIIHSFEQAHGLLSIELRLRLLPPSEHSVFQVPLHGLQVPPRCPAGRGVPRPALEPGFPGRARRPA